MFNSYVKLPEGIMGCIGTKCGYLSCGWETQAQLLQQRLPPFTIQGWFFALGIDPSRRKFTKNYGDRIGV